MKKKVLKFILFILIAALVYFATRFLSRFTFEEIWEGLKKFNLDRTENPIGLFFIFWIQIILILTIWDGLLLSIEIKVSLILSDIARFCIRRKKIGFRCH